jgi:CRP/FNR family transcriptional regulator, cyclic AMP receptor protein
MTVTIDQLRRVPLFEGLKDHDLHKIAEIGKEVRFQVGQTVLEADHSGVGFHLILEGTASVHLGDAEIGRFGPDDYFGEMSVIDGRPRSASVVAETELVTFAIPAWNFERLMEHHPTVMRGLLTTLTARIRAIESATS